MDLDFGRLIEKLKNAANNFVANANAYFHDLTRFEMISWCAEGAGLIFVILAFVLW